MFHVPTEVSTQHIIYTIHANGKAVNVPTKVTEAASRTCQEWPLRRMPRVFLFLTIA